MNATNRFLNRVLLLVVGAVLGAVGVTVLLVTVRPPWLEDAADTVARWAEGAMSAASGWATGLPSVGAIPGAALILLGTAAVLLVLLIAFIVTRGGGRTATVLRVDSGHGRTMVDGNVAQAVLAGRLQDRPDVLSAHTSAYRVKRAPAIKLTVTMRQGAHLPRVVRAVAAVVADWDALAGTRIPVVLHLEGRGWLDRWRSATRVR